MLFCLLNIIIPRQSFEDTRLCSDGIQYLLSEYKGRSRYELPFSNFHSAAGVGIGIGIGNRYLVLVYYMILSRNDSPWESVPKFCSQFITLQGWQVV